MKHVLDIEDVDFNFLDQMSDKTLINFCQTSKYSQLLCQDQIIKDRIENYKYCLNFDITYFTFAQLNKIIDDINYPFIFYFESNDVYMHQKNVLVGNDPGDYLTIDATYDVGERHISGDIHFHQDYAQGDFTIEDVLKRFDDIENVQLDLNSMYNIYRKTGCDHELAKDKMIKHINLKYYKVLECKKSLEDVDKTKMFVKSIGYVYKKYYELHFLYLWFVTHCIIFGLESDTIGNFFDQFKNDFTIEDMDEHFFNSEEYHSVRDLMFDEINRYYESLINYFT